MWSVNGYATQQRGDLAWVIANQAPSDILEIAFYSALLDANSLVVVDISR
jgi:hypothetical protein